MKYVVHQVPVDGFDKNFSYIIADTDSKHAYLVDPTGDFSLIKKVVDEHSYTVVGVLLTHTHFDHLEQVSTAVDTYAVPIHVHKNGQAETTSFTDVRTFDDNAKLPLGDGYILVLHTPGHSDDSVCFFIDEESTKDATPKVISGDTLFVGGCGRTTETRVKDLYESLAELKALPPDTEVYPGHDYGSKPHSTIGEEIVSNKFYQVSNFNEFYNLRMGK